MESRELRSIRHIVVKSMVDVRFHRSDNPALLILGGGAGPPVKTFFIGDKLVMEREGMLFSSGDGSFTVFGAGVVKTFVNGRLVSPRLQGQATVDISLPELPAFTLQGCGKAVLRGLDQTDLKINLEGFGRIEAIGRVGNLEVAVKGAGKVDAFALLAGYGDLQISGTGDIVVAVQADAYAEVSGVGNIVVHGNPLRRREWVTGMGRVRYL